MRRLLTLSRVSTSAREDHGGQGNMADSIDFIKGKYYIETSTDQIWKDPSWEVHFQEIKNTKNSSVSAKRSPGAKFLVLICCL